LCNHLLCACGSEAFYLEKIGINIKLHQQHIHQQHGTSTSGVQPTTIFFNFPAGISQSF